MHPDPIHNPCRIVPIAAGAAPVFTLAAPAPVDPAVAAAREAVWTHLRAGQPRLHDGPILLVDPAEVLAGRLVARCEGYKAFITAEQVNLEARNRIWALGIQGLVTAPDPRGRPCVLLARRAGSTRIYGGLWENAPSGAVPPPASASVGTTIGPAELLTALHQEAMEELALDLSACSGEWVAWLHDPNARTIDLVVRCPLPATTHLPCPAAANWEYLDAAWVPTAELLPWFTAAAHAFSPPTVALLQSRGWLAALPGAGNACAADPRHQERCPACGHPLQLVHVHGHAQCAVCGCNTAPCCQPD